MKKVKNEIISLQRGMIMSKYNKLIDYFEEDEISKYLLSDERVLYEVKPKKNAFILNQCFTMFPIALLWLCIDGTFISSFLFSGAFFSMAWFIIPFFALHLMPVWIWLKNVLTSAKNWENTLYVFTDRRLLIQSGINFTHQSVNYNKIRNVEIKTGVLDHFLNVQDIYLQVSCKKDLPLLDLENADEVYTLLVRIVENKENIEDLIR